MKKIISYIVGATLVAALSGTTLLAENKDDNGGLISLRGEVQLNDGQKSEDLKKVQKNQDAMNREFLHQPPLIPRPGVNVCHRVIILFSAGTQLWLHLISALRG